MLDAIKKLFRRKHTTPLSTGEGQGERPPLPTGEGSGERPPLRIEGTKPAPLTPEPDDAELAAQALLESLSPDPSPVGRGSLSPDPSPVERGGAAANDIPIQGGQRGALPLQGGTRGAGGAVGASYYHALADRIRSARTAEARLTMRLLASIEEQLAEPTALYRGQWGDTERKLYRAMDIAEREGGTLKSRWQHCMANVIVRRMEEERENEE